MVCSSYLMGLQDGLDMALELLSRSSLKDRQTLSSQLLRLIFGYVGALITLLAIAAFDITILNIGLKSDNIRDKTFIMGTFGCLIFQQSWNIGMILGLLPITGITLPMLSYGGSSLLSYMFAMGVIIDIDYQN